MGISDRHYFDWLCGALDRFEAESGRLSTLRPPGARCELWVLAGSGPNPSVTRLHELLGDPTTVRYLDRFAEGPEVARVDFNALGGLPSDACDALLMTRASYMVEDPEAFLLHTRRIVRPRGLMIIDWLHGLSDAPVLDLAGHHMYEGRPYPFLTTYGDAAALDEFAGEFDAFLRHVNRPPSWVDSAAPGTPVPFARRVRRLVSRRPRRNVTRATYLDVCRAELARAGKCLIEPALMEQYFKVVFRHARYFYPRVHKFNLHLLTVLEPVGK